MDGNKILSKLYRKRTVGILIVVAAVVLLAGQQSGAFLCRLGDRAYAGQAVDGEQAIAKLAAYASAVSDSSHLAFNETRASAVRTTVWLNQTRIEIKGFMMSVPYRDSALIYDSGFLLADDGLLYKTSFARC